MSKNQTAQPSLFDSEPEKKKKAKPSAPAALLVDVSGKRAEQEGIASLEGDEGGPDSPKSLPAVARVSTQLTVAKDIGEIEEVFDEVLPFTDRDAELATEIEKMIVSLPPAFKTGEMPIPNTILRSALFSGTAANGIYLHKEPLAALNYIQLRYTGFRLDQADYDVWHGIMRAAVHTPRDKRGLVIVHQNQLLGFMGKAVGGKQWKDVDDSIHKIKSGVIDISWEQKGKRINYTGSLIDSVITVDDTKTKKRLYGFQLNPSLSAFFVGGWSGIDVEVRKSFGKNMLAKWLHGFYLSHTAATAAKPISVDAIFELSGKGYSSRDVFKKALLKSLGLVNAAMGWNLEIFRPRRGTDVVRMSEKKPARKPRGNKSDPSSSSSSSEG